ncbi:MAG: methyltransferase domain-containing protein, partial [Deltaproteobacteria bacterium]|nr:methyltransferase domain-containing protein [Deltaproteobacteria bacterium]
MSANITAARTNDLQAFVSEYYGKLLASSADLKTNACCASGAPPAWIASRLANVHQDVANRFYGCGFPIPHGLSGATAVDLGCGTGRDVYVLSQLVGADGHVHGVDMTEEQLALAKDTAAWHADRFGYPRPNTTFHRGYVEDLRAVGLEDASVDVVVSNCVVNLSPRKDLVLAEVFRVLKPGGELYISDV